MSMNRIFISKLCLLAVFALSAAPLCLADGESVPARDPKQPMDEAYTAKIRKYTTAPYFSSPLVDYLPASRNVPTPEVVLGDVAGAPGILLTRKKFISTCVCWNSQPARESNLYRKNRRGPRMIAVAVSSEENLKNLEENRARLAKLADPRTIHLDDAEADRIVAESTPVYYITAQFTRQRRCSDRVDGTCLPACRG